VVWVKKALELQCALASSSPLQKAKAVLAAAAQHLEAKEALLTKAREAAAQLEGEVCALRAEKEAAERAVSSAAAAGGGVGGGSA
jgi:hypothetical protein